jgi:CubicO group peptidase (beta-lactamase class C family)
VAPAGVARALDLVRSRGAAAQICVLRDGQVVLDHAAGCRPDALFWIFSASKPFVALLVHLLAQRGRLSLDDRVARHWPEFGQRGKEAITVRQVLQHRSGLPVARGRVPDALAMTDWDRSIRHVERAAPRWPPGQVPAYHYISYGFNLGELVRRVAGAGVPEVLAAEFLGPLGLGDTFLGLPGALWPRHVPVRGRDPAALITDVYVNRRATRQAVIPAAGVSTTARDLARFYQALLRGGELDGVRVLDAATIERARQPSSDGETDRFLRLAIRWSQGFQLGGRGAGPAASRPMGLLASPDTFGHNGSNCCIAWADPSRRLVFAYLTDRLSTGPPGARHLAAVADAIAGACPRRSAGQVRGALGEQGLGGRARAVEDPLPYRVPDQQLDHRPVGPDAVGQRVLAGDGHHPPVHPVGRALRAGLVAAQALRIAVFGPGEGPEQVRRQAGMGGEQVVPDHHQVIDGVQAVPAQRVEAGLRCVRYQGLQARPVSGQADAGREVARFDQAGQVAAGLHRRDVRGRDVLGHVLVPGQHPGDPVQVHAVLVRQDAARPDAGGHRVAAVHAGLPAFEVLRRGRRRGLGAAHDRAVVERADGEDRQRGERLAVRPRAQVGGERHLADVELQPPDHPAERRDQARHLLELEREPPRGDGPVLQGAGHCVRAGHRLEHDVRHERR